jgi:hypothetical protein
MLQYDVGLLLLNGLVPSLLVIKTYWHLSEMRLILQWYYVSLSL